MKRVYFLLVSLVCLVGVLLFIFISRYSQPENAVVFLNPLGKGTVSPTPGVYLQIPTQGLSSRLSALMGVVHVIPWDSPDEVPATAGATLVQGDAIVTKADGKAKLLVDSVGEVELSAWTKLTIASLLEDTLSVRQDGGTVEFVVTKPLSVRLKSALVEIESGRVRTNVSGNTIRVDSMEGISKVGYVDFTGTTKVWSISAGKWVIIDDTRRRVRTNGALVGTD